jgi:hypothetical protein
MIRTDGPVPTPQRFGLGLGLVHSEQPAGDDAQKPVQARQHRDLPARLSPFRRRQLAGPGDRFAGLTDEVLADSGITDRSVGTVADHESVGSASDSDFLDLQVPGSLLVAALPPQRRLHARDPERSFSLMM